MIGLVDFDFQTASSVKLRPPNLEIMKLANYYKIEQNKFCKLVSLNEQELSGYQKIYFFSQQEKYPDIPKQFLQANNVIFGGTAFTKGEYIPFQNQIIDFTMPKINIYNQILKQKYDDGIKAKIIQGLLDNSYYRIYAGKNKLPIPPIIPRKRIYIYDNNFFYPDWKEIISEIVARKPVGIFTIHPIRCTTMTQFSQIRAMSKLARSNDVILDLDISLEECYYLFKVYKNIFLAEISKNTNVFLPLGGTFPTASQYRKDLVYKLNLLYSFWSRNIMIKVRYEEPHLGSIDPLSNLTKRIQRWANNDTKDQKSIQDIITKKNKKKKNIQIEQLNYLLKFIPSGKNLFNQTLTTIKKGGIWKI